MFGRNMLADAATQTKRHIHYITRYVFYCDKAEAND